MSSNQPALVRELLGMKILSTGSCVPEQVIRNEDLAELGYDSDWIVQRTGIKQRRHVSGSQATSHLAIEAAQRAIEAADVNPNDIDLLIVGTFTPDMVVPSAACMIQDALKLNVPAMDLNAACAGYIYSLVTAAQFIATGSSKLALVIGVDCNSQVVNPEDKKTFPLFGDGAGATLLCPGEKNQGLAAYTLGADGSGGKFISRPVGGSLTPITHEAIDEGKHFIHMEGRPVFKWAIRKLSESIRQVLDHTNLTINDIDHVILHQANLRILEAAANDLSIPAEKLVVNLDRFGNTSAGSIPIALDESVRAGKIKTGDRVLFSGFGAGLVWGTAIFNW